MKYYLNFVLNPDDGVSKKEYRIPTDPMYKQDGVYNQRCKYRLSNFQLLGAPETIQEELRFLEGKTIILRINNTPALNVFTFIKSNASLRTQLGQRPIEFHIRCNNNPIQIVGEALGHPAQTQFIGTGDGTGVIDQLPVMGATFPTTIEEHLLVATELVSGSAGVAAPLNYRGIDFLVGGFGYNSFDEELIGTPLWGEVPDITFHYYNNNGVESPFIDDAALGEVNIAFTIEMEPIAVKL